MAGAEADQRHMGSVGISQRPSMQLVNAATSHGGVATLLGPRPLAAGARVTVGTFEVTPGDVTLRATFSNGATATTHLEVQP